MNIYVYNHRRRSPPSKFETFGSGGEVHEGKKGKEESGREARRIKVRLRSLRATDSRVLRSEFEERRNEEQHQKGAVS